MALDPFKRLITIAWNNLNRRTINGDYPNWKCKGTARYLQLGIELHLTRKQLETWFIERQKLVYDMWHAGERPSIDRIDSSGHYTLENIRLVTLKENKKAGSASVLKAAVLREIEHYCKFCGKKLVRRPFKNGQSESTKTFNKRKFCSHACYRGKNGRTR